jgi:hypothetical protein
MKQVALFSRYTPTADLTAIAQKSPVLILLIACSMFALLERGVAGKDTMWYQGEE